jgi:hypothetical protein
MPLKVSGVLEIVLNGFKPSHLGIKLEPPIKGKAPFEHKN